MLKFCTWTICTKKTVVKKFNQDLYALLQAIIHGLDSVIDKNTEIETGKERRKMLKGVPK